MQSTLPCQRTAVLSDEAVAAVHQAVRELKDSGTLTVDPQTESAVAALAAQLASTFKALGFKFVTLDLEGFRSGSMNALLSAEDLLRQTG